MDVLRVILDWSSSRPNWQRDALRRLVTRGNLEESDIDELTLICKSTHGLAEKCDSDPLTKKHIPKRTAGLDAVTLTQLTHHRGVNALANNQTIEFGPALTVVYGGNASGKSGYTRILKQACRARGAEEVLGNVLANSAPGQPSASIRFTVGQESRVLDWSDQSGRDDSLGHVSVFDSHCAGVYLSKRTDVAFRPFGLDLFDKLSDACEAVRKKLDTERRELEKVQVTLPDLPEGTTAQQLLSNITALTPPENVRAAARLSDDERSHATEIRKRFSDLQAEHPEKTARALSLRADRLDRLKSHLAEVDEALGDTQLMSVFGARDEERKARAVAEQVKATAIPSSLLSGTGSDVWRALWEAARRFSVEEAYPGEAFPFTSDSAHCVLCQQELQSDGAERLTRFERFIQSTSQQQVGIATRTYRTHHERIRNLVISNPSTESALQELRIEQESVAQSIERNLVRARERREQALQALTDGQPRPTELPHFQSCTAQIAREVSALRDRAAQLQQNSRQAVKDQLLREIRELDAREQLGKNVASVLSEIERKKKLAVYQVSLQDTNTQAVTRKSTEVTKAAVTEQLAAAFKDELDKLRFRHLEVELQAAGGSRGALSIAAFFAELSTASDRSAVLFDDPVSSLDHTWRDSVAGRLVEAARTRQVVVFTHDIVFLLALERFSEELAVEVELRHLRREASGAGVHTPEMPWVAMKVNKRIGVLKSKHQGAEKLHRDGRQAEYESNAAQLYGLLRETWERAVEEVLLAGVVERYRPNIQTLQSKDLADITADDCHTLEVGMSKCSRWLPGHDQAVAENAPFPDPSELQRDIETLENWVKGIRKRRTLGLAASSTS